MLFDHASVLLAAKWSMNLRTVFADSEILRGPSCRCRTQLAAEASGSTDFAANRAGARVKA
jgi:hypothetical protein